MELGGQGSEWAARSLVQAGDPRAASVRREDWGKFGRGLHRWC